MKRIFNKKELHSRRVDLRINQTPHEGILWQLLKDKGLDVKFRRQHSVGPYILDFYCTELKLAIEIDGSQHINNSDYDRERDNFLKSKEIITLRFWNNEINNSLEGVIMKIKKEIENLSN